VNSKQTVLVIKFGNKINDMLIKVSKFLSLFSVLLAAAEGAKYLAEKRKKKRKFF